jgi:hypothetical protein
MRDLMRLNVEAGSARRAPLTPLRIIVFSTSWALFASRNVPFPQQGGALSARIGVKGRRPPPSFTIPPQTGVGS